MRLASYGLCVVLAGCAARYVRRAPQEERASYLIQRALRTGMSVGDVMTAAIELRGVEQDAVLESKSGCEPSTRIEVGSCRATAKLTPLRH